jgi:glycosyltransferase involved in cell wall biosynthesis
LGAVIPTVLYFHENQFAFPQDRQQHSLLEAQMVSLYSALAADRIVFNSAYNRRSFFEGCETLLQRLPDKVPAGVIACLQEKASVLAVPVAEHGSSGEGRGWPGSGETYPQRPVRLLWVGRFEHDKGGDTLRLILHQLEQAELNYELAMIGQQFRNSPKVFHEIEKAFSHRLVQFGYLDSTQDYRQYLEDADIVLSTALHEFQGLAVLEAVTAGCLPAVPDRLVYPEIFPREFIYESDPEHPDREAIEAVRLLTLLADAIATGSSRIPDVTAFDPHSLKPAYQKLFDSMAPQ